MAVRQYIGARYVPKFYEGSNGSAWDQGVQYEPLIIVSYLNNYYTSKKTVPATIGAPNLNPDYWANIGLLSNLEQRINEVASELDSYEDTTDDKIEDIEDDIFDLQIQNGGKYIFLGDSYASPSYGDWIQKAAADIGLTTSEYYNLAQDGSSLSSGDWLQYLQTWVGSHASEVENIGTIVLGGGINDSDSNHVPLLWPAIEAFMTYVKATFSANTRVLFFYFGWALDTSSILYGRTATWRAAVQMAYERVPTVGGIYVPGGELCLHNRVVLASDGLHPNNNGGNVIARYVANGCRNGCWSIHNADTATVTTSVFSVGGNINQYISGGNSIIRFNEFQLQGSVSSYISVSGGAYFDFCDVVLPFGNNMSPFNTLLQIYDVAKGILFLHAKIKIEEGKLKIAFIEYDTTQGAYYSGNVASVNPISFVQMFPGMLD